MQSRRRKIWWAGVHTSTAAGEASNIIKSIRMIHPSTELRLVDAVIGYGVFATGFLPRGTIIDAQDALEARV